MCESEEDVCNQLRIRNAFLRLIDICSDYHVFFVYTWLGKKACLVGNNR